VTNKMKTETIRKREHDRFERTESGEWARMEGRELTDEEEEEAEWADAIERAKLRMKVVSLPPPFPARQSFDLRAWEERIDRATKSRSDQSAPRSSIRERLERLAARATEAQDRQEIQTEEALWQAAIRRAKTGHS
jgi:hypothetical protein